MNSPGVYVAKAMFRLRIIAQGLKRLNRPVARPAVIPPRSKPRRGGTWNPRSTPSAWVKVCVSLPTSEYT